MLSFTILNEDEFGSFVSNLQTNNFLQSIYAYERYKKTSREVYICGLRERERIVCASIVLCTHKRYGAKIFSLPGGPILDYNDKRRDEIMSNCSRELCSFLRKRGGIAVEISPYIAYNDELTKSLLELGYKELGEYVQPKWVSVLDLTSFTNEEELLLSFRQSHRRSIRKALKTYGVFLKELSLAELPIFYELVKKSSVKHGFSLQPLTYYEEMFRSFGENIKFIVSYYDDIPLAGAMFVLYGDEIVYLYGGSDPKNGKYCGSFAIHWHMLKFALENNYKYYNFYGVKPFPGDGVYEFKLGFRAGTREMMGTFILPIGLKGKLYKSRLKYKKYGNVF